VKKLLLLTLALVFVLQHLLVIVLFVSFEANRDYISKVLCINREDVDSNCDGQCFFMQKLNENNSSAGHLTLLEKNGIEYLEEQSASFSVVCPEIFPGIQLGRFKPHFYSFDFNLRVERPPAV
jgi:hypothetical protein